MLYTDKEYRSAKAYLYKGGLGDGYNKPSVPNVIQSIEMRSKDPSVSPQFKVRGSFPTEKDLKSTHDSRLF